MRIDESAQRAGTQPFDDGFSLNPATEVAPAGLDDAVIGIQTGATQSELDLRAQAVTEGQSLSPAEASLRRLGRDRRAMVCLAIILILVVTSYVFPVFYLHMGPNLLGGITGTTQTPPELYHYMVHQELLNLDAPSSLQHPLGTDQLGRDIFARLMAG